MIATVRRHDYRGALQPVGTVVVGLAVAMLLCAAIGGGWDWLQPRAQGPRGGIMPLIGAAAGSFAFGIPLYLYGRRFSSESLNRRQAVLAVTLIWLGAGICGAFPFMLAAQMGPADAFFESVSGLTTTGATVITDIESRLSRPVLLWRSVIQWLGGMGIVVLFVAVFPTVGAGGKHMFRGEVPGTSAEGLKPRIAETSFTLWKLYALFTVVELGILVALGMEPFEALCHALTTLSTGGFSTRDASVGGFNSPAIEYVIAIFMLIGSLNYGLYYAALRGRSLRVIHRNIEFRAFVAIVVVSVVALTGFNYELHGSVSSSFRNALFMVGTSVSSTGYGNHDYTTYGSPAFLVMILLMFVGGCSGSTAGGIKVERIVLLMKQAIAQVRRSYQPAVVSHVRMGRQVVGKDVLADVSAFFVIYLGSMVVGVAMVAVLENVTAPTAFGAMLTCLSNMGPAPFHTIADNFAHYHAITKVIFVLAMLLGRLEFFTILALFVPGFWKR